MRERASNGRIGLKPTQKQVVAALKSGAADQLTRSAYEQLAGVSRSQAAYDLAELVEAGILERRGGGRATRYRLARQDKPGQRHWTPERIRAALTDFCRGHETWPTASEFKAAGRADLYVAASRYGGIGFWAAELAFARPGRATPPRVPVPAWRPRLRWAAGGAALAGVLFAAAGAAVYAWHDSPARDAGAPQALQNAPTRAAAKAPGHKVATAKPTRTRTRTRQVTRSSPTPRVQTSTPAYNTELAVQRVSVSPPTHYASSTQSTTASTGSSGPAPLPPPAGGGSGGPAPLPPPRH